MKKENMVSKYSLEIQEYLKELEHVADSLKRIGELEPIFQKSLMVFMDEGWGYKEFLETIAEKLAPFYGVSSEDVYFQHFPESYDKGVAAWKRNAKGLDTMAEKVQKEKTFAIISCDLSEFVDELSDPDLVAALKTMVENGRNMLIIFRFPYMRELSSMLMEEKFSHWFSVRRIMVPPICLEQRVCCVKDYLEKSGYECEDGIEEVLKEWLQENKKNIDTGGYRLLRIMAGEVIYQNALCSKGEENNQDVEKYITAATIESMIKTKNGDEDAYELLNELVGMSEIKGKVREIVAQIKMQKKWEEQGKNIGKPSMHMLFYGNPGTGKTTFARILGKIFKQEGLLSKGEFQETTGSFFVEGLISELMKKVRNTCKDARGSILFIDEAYGMGVGHSKGNVAEDIMPVLVAEMENYRDDMCVIFAGYEDEMEDFLKKNSGLKSRIPHILRFPNYSKEELEEIFFQMTDKSFEYEEELKETLREYLDSISTDAYDSKEFSNARFVRNLYERVWGKTAYRINFSADKEEILKVADMNAALEEEMFSSMVEKKQEKRIGFAVN